MKAKLVLSLVVLLASCQSSPPRLGSGRLKAAAVLQQVFLPLGPGVEAVSSRRLNFAQMFLLQEILARQTWVKLGPKESTYGAEWSLRLEPERGEEFTLVAFRRGETIRLMSDISGEWYVCILSEDDSKRFLSVIVVADPEPALPVFGGGWKEPSQPPQRDAGSRPSWAVHLHPKLRPRSARVADLNVGKIRNRE